MNQGRAFLRAGNPLRFFDEAIIDVDRGSHDARHRTSDDACVFAPPLRGSHWKLPATNASSPVTTGGSPVTIGGSAATVGRDGATIGCSSATNGCRQSAAGCRRSANGRKRATGGCQATTSSRRVSAAGCRDSVDGREVSATKDSEIDACLLLRPVPYCRLQSQSRNRPRLWRLSAVRVLRMGLTKPVHRGS